MRVFVLVVIPEDHPPYILAVYLAEWDAEREGDAWLRRHPTGCFEVQSFYVVM